MLILNLFLHFSNILFAIRNNNFLRINYSIVYYYVIFFFCIFQEELEKNKKFDQMEVHRSFSVSSVPLNSMEPPIITSNRKFH